MEDESIDYDQDKLVDAFDILMRYTERYMGNKSYTMKLEKEQRYLKEYNQILALTTLYNQLTTSEMVGMPVKKQWIDDLEYFGYKYRNDGKDIKMLKSRIMSMKTRYDMRVMGEQDNKQDDKSTYEQSVQDIAQILSLSYPIPAYEISLAEYCTYVQRANKAVQQIKENQNKHGKQRSNVF